MLSTQSKDIYNAAVDMYNATEQAKNRPFNQLSSLDRKWYLAQAQDALNKNPEFLARWDAIKARGREIYESLDLACKTRWEYVSGSDKAWFYAKAESELEANQ